MNTNFYGKAGENIANEPVSVEPDGTVWVDSDGRVLDAAQVAAEVARLAQAEADREAAKASALAKLEALGLTAEEAQAIAGI